MLVLKFKYSNWRLLKYWEHVLQRSLLINGPKSIRTVILIPSHINGIKDRLAHSLIQKHFIYNTLSKKTLLHNSLYHLLAIRSENLTRHTHNWRCKNTTNTQLLPAGRQWKKHYHSFTFKLAQRKCRRTWGLTFLTLLGFTSQRISLYWVSSLSSPHLVSIKNTNSL